MSVSPVGSIQIPMSPLLKVRIESLNIKQIKAISHVMLNVVATGFYIRGLKPYTGKSIEVYLPTIREIPSMEENTQNISCRIAKSLSRVTGLGCGDVLKEIDNKIAELRRVPIEHDTIMIGSELLHHFPSLLEKMLTNEKITHEGFIFSFNNLSIKGKFKIGTDDKLKIVFKTSAIDKYLYDVEEITREM